MEDPAKKKPVETLHRSEELEHETPASDEPGLDEQDKTDADSFPASDPPSIP